MKNYFITEAIMENFKFIGEWLNEKGIELRPAFSENLHDMCSEFKKTDA